MRFNKIGVISLVLGLSLNVGLLGAKKAYSIETLKPEILDLMILEINSDVLDLIENPERLKSFLYKLDNEYYPELKRIWGLWLNHYENRREKLIKLMDSVMENPGRILDIQDLKEKLENQILTALLMVGKIPIVIRGLAKIKKWAKTTSELNNPPLIGMLSYVE